jgi:hypothetical protein
MEAALAEAVVGLVMLCAGVALYLQAQRFLRSAVSVMGEITYVEETRVRVRDDSDDRDDDSPAVFTVRLGNSSRGEYRTRYRPTYAFTPQRGRKQHFIGGLVDDEPSIGDEVEVLYNPADPSEAEVAGESRSSLIAFGVGFVGAALLAVSGVTYFTPSEDDRPPARPHPSVQGAPRKR